VDGYPPEKRKGDILNFVSDLDIDLSIGKIEPVVKGIWMGNSAGTAYFPKESFAPVGAGEMLCSFFPAAYASG